MSKENKTKEEIFKELKEDQITLKRMSGEEREEEKAEEQQEEIETIEEQKSPTRRIPFPPFVILLFLMITILVFSICQKYAPHLTLKQPSKIIIEYKEPYEEPGYQLIINGKDRADEVKVLGKVNSKKLGKYTVTYQYQKGLIKKEKKRTVYVKDLTSPAIILCGGKVISMCPNQDYKEDGYLAIDNYDGNLSKKVKVKEKENEYTYSVVDSSKNKSTITRKIVKKDTVKPTITLEKGNIIHITQDSTYQEEGYLAKDNCDGDITSQVKVTGKVDTSQIGTYKVTYTVSDHSGNKTSVIRTIHVQKKSSPGTIYLTFDDGPRSGTTDFILDILKEENIKATFFVTASGPDELIKREYEEGHTVGLHTASHNYSEIYSSKEAYFNDLKIVQDRVEKIIGMKSTIIRFPGGSSNTISRKYTEGIMTELTKEVLERGYYYYDWNISSGDAGETKDRNAVVENVINHLSKDQANVVLMHDIKPYTRDALKQIIEYGKANGYTFERITEETEMITQKVNN